MNFLKDGLSVDEAKFSTLMLILIAFSGMGIYTVVTDGDMPMNLTNFLYALVAAIAGINMVKVGASYVKDKKDSIEVSTDLEYRQVNDHFEDVMNADDQPKKDEMPI